MAASKTSGTLPSVKVAGIVLNSCDYFFTSICRNWGQFLPLCKPTEQKAVSEKCRFLPEFRASSAFAPRVARLCIKVGQFSERGRPRPQNPLVDSTTPSHPFAVTIEILCSFGVPCANASCHIGIAPHTRVPLAGIPLGCTYRCSMRSGGVATLNHRLTAENPSGSEIL